jgi:hypothetical protein
VEFRLGTAEQRHEFFVDDLYDLLARSEAAEDFLPDCSFLDPADEVLDNFEVYISLEERQAHLAQGLFNVVFLENAPAPELLENNL